MQTKLVAIDLDGTLLTDHYTILPHAKSALKQLEKKGIQMIICTGRGPNASFHIFAELEQEGPLIAHNGGVTLNYPEKKLLSTNVMSMRDLHGVIGYCRERAIHFDASSAFNMYIENRTAAADVMYEKYRVYPIMLKAIETLVEGVAKFTLFAPPNVLDDAYQELVELNTHLRFARSGETFIDVLHPKATKEDALHHFCAIHKIKQQEVVAIGNYYNDIGMLKWAGLGIAMANSPEEVRAVADVVTGSNNENGIEAAIMNYILTSV